MFMAISFMRPLKRQMLSDNQVFHPSEMVAS
jgi:hypothetical protein